MRILMYSEVFPPQVGGIERVGALLAREWARRGAEVTVATPQRGAAEAAADEPYDVLDASKRGAAVSAARASDVVAHNHLNPRLAGQIFAAMRPQAALVHTWLRASGRVDWRGRTRVAASRLTRRAAVSEAVAGHLPRPVEVLPNPYDTASFCRDGPVEVSGDLVFAGRLVPDKGADLLIEALARLRSEGFAPSVAVVGEGPERSALEALAQDRGVENEVRFLGSLSSERLAGVFRGHRAVVVPSRWREPFGMVALEGIACGCVPVVTDRGGLPEAAGACGLVCPRPEPTALAETLGRFLRDPEGWRTVLETRSEEHVAPHRPEAAGERHMAFLRACAR